MNLIPWRKKHTIPVSREAVGPAHVSEFRNEMDRLIDKFIGQLDDGRYDLISPEAGSERSSLVVLSHHDKSKNEHIHKEFTRRGIHMAPSRQSAALGR